MKNSLPIHIGNNYKPVWGAKTGFCMSLLFNLVQSTDWWQEAMICIKQTHPAVQLGFVLECLTGGLNIISCQGLDHFSMTVFCKVKVVLPAFSIFSNNSQAILQPAFLCDSKCSSSQRPWFFPPWLAWKFLNSHHTRIIHMNWRCDLFTEFCMPSTGYTCFQTEMWLHHHLSNVGCIIVCL
jgi:hypothetical protein